MARIVGSKREAYEGGEDHVDGLCLDDLAQRLVPGIDFHVRVGKACLEVFVVSLVGDDHSGGLNCRACAASFSQLSLAVSA